MRTRDETSRLARPDLARLAIAAPSVGQIRQWPPPSVPTKTDDPPNSCATFPLVPLPTVGDWQQNDCSVPWLTNEARRM
jgi:hypothetical protein